jgi:hypothetical protein
MRRRPRNILEKREVLWMELDTTYKKCRKSAHTFLEPDLNSRHCLDISPSGLPTQNWATENYKYIKCCLALTVVTGLNWAQLSRLLPEI